MTASSEQKMITSSLYYLHFIDDADDDDDDDLDILGALAGEFN